MLDIRDYNWSNSFEEDELEFIQYAINNHDTLDRLMIARLSVICSQYELALDDYGSEE